jgi:hypothetical protein
MDVTSLPLESVSLGSWCSTRSSDAHRRFLEERRILALLEHPGIARLIDGGVTSQGVSWFAMELVEGEPIDVYCDARQLSVDQRLDRFIDVCDAVQWGRGETDEFETVVAVLERAWSDLGEFAVIDSALGTLITRRERAYGPGQVPTLLAFLHGQNKVRLGEIDSADLWIGRALRDTTQRAGSLANWMPPVLAGLRLDQGRLGDAEAAIARLPGGLRGRRATAALLRARFLDAKGNRKDAATLLEREMAALYAESPMTLTLFTLPLLTAGEWRLALGDASGADSLARMARAAATLDTLTLERSGLVGRAELLLARALAAQGKAPAARDAVQRAIVALTNGYGPSNRWARDARALLGAR